MGSPQPKLALCSAVPSSGDPALAPSAASEHTLLALLQPILDGTPAVVFVKDRIGRHQLVNAAFLRLFGLCQEQVLGRTDAELFPAATAAALLANDRAVWADAQPRTLEERMPTPHGERIYRTEKFLLRDARGAPVALCGTAVDITDLHRARAELQQRGDELALARERLERAVERTEVAQQAAGASLYEWRPNSDAVVRNETLHEVVGWSPAQLSATKEGWRALVHPQDRPALDADVARLLHDGTPLALEYRVRHRDGRWLWVTDQARAVRDAAGRVERVVGMVIDTTERKRIEHELRSAEQHARATFDNAAVGIAHVGLDGRWLRVNDRLCAVLQRSRPDLLGLSFQDITHPDDLHTDLVLMQRLLAGEIPSYALEKRYRRPDGSLLWAYLTVSLVRTPEGAPEHFISVVEDVTERKRVEGALREADARKDEFLATLSHELRNPLAPIVNAAAILVRHEVLTPHGQRAVAIIERQAAQMKRLLDDLLEVSRITRGTIELRPQPLALDDAVRHAVEDALPAAQAKGLALQARLPARPLTVLADPVRIAQVLGNLLANACKYTPRGGHVTVHAESDGDGAVVRVADDGIGIEPAQLESVFELFMQAQPGVGEHQGGLGIGLAMVQRLVQMHGGSVRADSAGCGRGATFTVRLPCHAGATAAAAATVTDA